MDIEELCARVNSELEHREIHVVDGRIADRITPRNVRYYQTLGLIGPPTRQGGRAVYDDGHVRKIIEIKAAQSRGLPLGNLPTTNPGVDEPLDRSFLVIHANKVRSIVQEDQDDRERPVRFGLRSADMTPKFASSMAAVVSSSPLEFGWSVKIGRMTLSGQGDRPSPEQLDAIARIVSTDFVSSRAPDDAPHVNDEDPDWSH